MTFEAVINHPDGSRQFDSSAPALCLRRKGVLNQSNSYQETPPGLTGYYLFAKFSWTGVAPQIAIRPTNCNTAITKMNRSGNSFEFIFRLFDFSTGWSIQYWIFDLPTTATDLPADPNALVFWDENGQVTFDSSYPPMRMVREQQAGKAYAVVPAGGAAYSERVETDVDTFGNPIVIWTTQEGGFQRSGETISIVLRDTMDHYYSANDVAYTPSYFLIDVTNL